MAETIDDLINGADHVLFGFDGPLCRLFVHHPAAGIAHSLVRWLDRHGGQVRLTDGQRTTDDPHEVLRTVGLRHPGSDVAEALERELTRQELLAARSAWPTAYADPLIRTWSAVAQGLAVAGDNSSRAMEEYLAGRGLRECFATHIHGRTPDLAHLTPDPDCVLRALDSLGATPATSLMIGSTPADLLAARAVGVGFLGYAPDAGRAERLRAAGGAVVVESLVPVLAIVRRRR
ncbi:HAD family phosphatase [Streptomyces sp. PKU-MA01144]|uniref:HAD family hydrolase n=1 Tax=Streptomyces sp. PKU-MA01144 TaxID=2729138 RepID=UPI00148131BF|nr:HAD family hydrolase [Streptomyces sp. PKU-MA01144]NNJ03098.1 HAD family phosphatase [Streptomyces sp. PKU-MA01144]